MANEILGRDFKLAAAQHDKALVIESPSTDIILELDYDDVDHYKMDEFANVIIRNLNQITDDEWWLAQFKAQKMRKMDETGDEYLYE
jgi:hypothetical protein